MRQGALQLPGDARQLLRAIEDGLALDADLVLWYKFDESTGTTAADSSMYASAAENATLATLGAGAGATFSTVKQVGTHAVKLTPQ